MKRIIYLYLVLFLPTYFSFAQQESVNTLFAQANELFVAGEVFDARRLFKQLHEQLPHSFAVNYNLGMAYAECNQHEKALACYKQALKAQPNNPDLEFLMALSHLALGNYQRGWQLYESRWHKADKRHIVLPWPRWQAEPLEGKRILLLSEGALGDTLQFIRYAQEVQKLGAHVTVHVPRALQKLLQQCPFIDATITTITTTDRYDYWTSLMSLPSLFNTTLDTVPTQIPYITVDPAAQSLWHAQIDHQRLSIGLCWQADPSNDANRPPIARRSIDLTCFKPLATLPGVQLISLQRPTDIPKTAMLENLTIFDGDFDCSRGRFIDTAALIANLDLVVCVDTSIAHLAGALGVPTILLLPYKADWRWMVDRDDTPWYPTMQLLRRAHHESWNAVIARLVTLIKEEHV